MVSRFVIPYIFRKYREAYAREQQRGMSAGDEDGLLLLKSERIREEVLRQIAVLLRIDCF